MRKGSTKDTCINWEELFYKFHKGIYPYLGTDKNVSINSHCKIHGAFKVAKIYLLKGAGCAKCSYLKKRKTKEQFIIDAKKIHGELYDYSEVNYENAHTKINIICKEHGMWSVKPNTHLSGTGCPTCGSIIRNTAYKGRTERDPTKIECYLYLNKFKNKEECFYKVGISVNLDSRYRSRKIDYEINNILKIKMNLFEAVSIEQKILEKLKQHQHIPKQAFGGKYECLNEESLNTILKLINEYTTTKIL